MKIRHTLSILIFCFFLGSYAQDTALFPFFTIAQQKSHENNIGPRFQWDANDGYCGETSMISAGLYFGQYLSQYDVRAIASPGKKQYEESAQLLLGVNDTSTARSLKLNYEYWSSPYAASDTFMVWVKQHVVQGHPVIIGVFNNCRLLDEKLPGDDEYDHIVPVVGFAYLDTLSYSSSDIILFSDNGLYSPGNSVPYYHQFRMAPKNREPFQKDIQAFHFLGNRKNANKPSGNIYSLLKLTIGDISKGRHNYAIAITGVADFKKETLPVQVFTSVNYEFPEMVDGSNTRPDSMQLDLTVKVSRLESDSCYVLYQYDDETKVPTENFILNSASAIKCWNFKGQPGLSTWSTVVPIYSNDKAFFRAVKVNHQNGCKSSETE